MAILCGFGIMALYLKWLGLAGAGLESQGQDRNVVFLAEFLRGLGDAGGRLGAEFAGALETKQFA